MTFSNKIFVFKGVTLYRNSGCHTDQYSMTSTSKTSHGRHVGIIAGRH